ncbi:hypothetical protein [Tianweitania sediminis]|uniref:Uncharacterized protein n=1 Tax=Tianweitania sediminis TaxID=1502156 RepID=A0A8J7RPC9_9HYPH|nr:hypothetical protein [Tianweitania sediminis]MBP0439554.1 hypothetical protein [Tianweitania sediminis]
MNNSASPEAIYTPDEVAERLRLPRRSVIIKAKQFGLCFVVGRSIRLTEAHVQALIVALQYKSSSEMAQHHAARVAGSQAFDRIVARVQKQNADRAEGIAQRRAKAAEERQARLAEKQRMAAERKAAPPAAFAQIEEQPAEPLDLSNRDPAYWTPARKRQYKERKLKR